MHHAQVVVWYVECSRAGFDVELVVGALGDVLFVDRDKLIAVWARVVVVKAGRVHELMDNHLFLYFTLGLISTPKAFTFPQTAGFYWLKVSPQFFFKAKT